MLSLLKHNGKTYPYTTTFDKVEEGEIYTYRDTMYFSSDKRKVIKVLEEHNVLLVSDAYKYIAHNGMTFANDKSVLVHGYEEVTSKELEPVPAFIQENGLM